MNGGVEKEKRRRDGEISREGRNIIHTLFFSIIITTIITTTTTTTTTTIITLGKTKKKHIYIIVIN